jgi:hypothetical protein
MLYPVIRLKRLKNFNESSLILWPCIIKCIVLIIRLTTTISSSRTIALGSTQPLREMFIRDFPGGKGRPTCKVDNFTAICEPVFWRKCGRLDISKPYGSPRSLTAIPLPFANTGYLSRFEIESFQFRGYI